MGGVPKKYQLFGTKVEKIGGSSEEMLIIVWIYLKIVTVPVYLPLSVPLSSM
jgi:hypothetical protein